MSTPLHDVDLDNVNPALVSLAIERTLLDISEAVLEDTGKQLYKKYNCYFYNCLEHPEYLVDVLQNKFGDSHLSIILSINKKLEEFDYKEQIKNFLTEIQK